MRSARGRLQGELRGLNVLPPDKPMIEMRPFLSALGLSSHQTSPTKPYHPSLSHKCLFTDARLTGRQSTPLLCKHKLQEKHLEY